MLKVAKALGDHIKVKTEVTVKNYPISLLELDGFYWKRDKIICKHTVFNYTPVYNELEKGFAKFLDEHRILINSRHSLKPIRSSQLLI